MSDTDTFVPIKEPTTPDTIDLTSEEVLTPDDSVLFVSHTGTDNGVEFVSMSQASRDKKNKHPTDMPAVVTGGQLTILDDDEDNLDLPSLDLDRKFKAIAEKRSTLEVSRDTRPPILCGICREDEFFLQANKRTLVSTHCGHIFCKPCLDLSLAKYKCCPICRKSLTAKSGYHVIFL
eukprot:TRINITY_DN68_c1_g1_i1.p1 TRINITY_DN68_c1_g1~~TRINITY_DN68_c1_g1_i1.p1  ORF type:complete len:193 (+),score=36.36 TRINITY_DN68_c1_g1_i1:49-579(+)